MAILTKFRTIKTGIFDSLKETHETSNLLAHELPITWDRAEGFQVYDKRGNKWIDFTSGIFVANVGHGAQKVKDAITSQVDSLIHSYIFPNEPRIKLAKKLCEIARMEKVLFTVTGSEANDAAIQMIQRNKEGKILSLEGAYYGSTIGCRSLTNTIDESTPPGKFDPNDIAGVFLQIFRGRDANFLPYNWIRIWCEWAKENNIPFGFDEMQSGIGRTGKWFGFQHYNIKPDFITVGKALGGGLPISAVVGCKKLLKYDDDLWSTHTGNPVCCAAALATLEIIEEQNLLEKTAEKNDWFAKLLIGTFPNNKIYGHGMIWAIETGEATQKIIRRCAENGLLLVSTYGDMIKIGPPLTIPDEALREGIEVLAECSK